MSINLKICEHESVEWIIKKLPKFHSKSFFKKLRVNVTSFDLNTDVFVIGTDYGCLYYINRRNNHIQTLLLKKNKEICKISVIQTIDLSIAVGFFDGSVFILKIDTQKEVVFHEASQFILPVDHSSAITCLSWSKNSEKLFTGDLTGNVFCTEVNNTNRTVSSYRICETTSHIISLSYSHKFLVVSSENENFIYNLSTNLRLEIGTKPRSPGHYGSSFIDKVCKLEEAEILVIRPDSKIWISDINGVIKRSILLKSETLFSVEKSISLLPSITSQTNSGYADKVLTGIIKPQLGLVNMLNETQVLFWSKNGIIIFDLSSGKIISSTCNLGIILSVSICRFNNVIDHELPTYATVECKNMYKNLSEIWILRKPVLTDESTLVRLSTIPLATSKLTIDTFNYLAQYSNKSICDNELIVNTKLELAPVLEEVTPAVKSHDHWIPGFDIKIPDTLQDMRSNVLELTKKTKEIFTQSRDIFEYANEGVEQAMELTEEGLLINFNKNIDGKFVINNNCDMPSDSNLEVNKLLSNEVTTKRQRKHVRKIQFINFDDDTLGEEDPSRFFVTGDYTIERQNPEDVIGIATQILPKERIISIESDIGHTNSDIQECKSLYDELYFTNNENEFSASSGDHISPFLSAGYIPDHFEDNLKPAGTSNDYIPDAQLSLTATKPTDKTDVDKNDQNVFCLSDNIHSNVKIDYSYPIAIEDGNKPFCDNYIEDKSIDSLPYFEEPEIYSETDTVKEMESKLTDRILCTCNKWISHRGPTLVGNNKIASLSINRRMIWITDTKGSLYVGFRNIDERMDNLETNTRVHLQWFQDNILLTDKIYSSPEGVILWRDKSGDLLVYTGITRIWTPKVVKEKVLLKSNWEILMVGIKDIDIDNDMVVVVNKKGELKVMNEISDRNYHKQLHTASIAGHVILATTFNGIIWCVTEIIDPDSKTVSQHIFACFAKDDDGKLNISYWKTVPIPRDLIAEKEEHLGILGGSLAIKYIQLGVSELAWIVTFQNRCFFSKNISEENPTGDGIWYQISLTFLSHIITANDENAVFGFDIFSYGLQSRMEKIFGYPESKSRSYSNTAISSILISAKGAPKRSVGNGLIWVTCVEKNSPCILFESDKYILGHGWLDCFASSIMKKTIALPATLTWYSVTFGFKNVLWLISNSNEIFCYWKSTRIQNITVSSNFGDVMQIATHSNTVLLLTRKQFILIRIGITSGNAIGTDWKEISNPCNTHQEFIKHICCFENELWLVTSENIFYNEDLRSLTGSISKKSKWKSMNLKVNDSSTNTISNIQVYMWNKTQKYIWSSTDLDGHVYLGTWNNLTASFEWTYIPGPRAKSVHISDENVWMIELLSGEIFVRCGIDSKSKATGDYWTHIPISTVPVISLSVSSNNDVAVIDCKERLLSHFWTIIKGNVMERVFNETLDESSCSKLADEDWELLN